MKKQTFIHNNVLSISVFSLYRVLTDVFFTYWRLAYIFVLMPFIFYVKNFELFFLLKCATLQMNTTSLISITTLLRHNWTFLPEVYNRHVRAGVCI